MTKRLAIRDVDGHQVNLLSDRGVSGPLFGQLLRHSERREVAIFLRDGVLWVADFIDGQGQLVEATTWFRFHCGAYSSSASSIADGS